MPTVPPYLHSAQDVKKSSPSQDGETHNTSNPIPFAVYNMCNFSAIEFNGTVPEYGQPDSWPCADLFTPTPETIPEDLLQFIYQELYVDWLSPSASLAFLICYTVLFICGVLLNAIVAHVIWKKRATLPTKNLYILNLTISDLLICFLCMPFTLHALLHKDWTFGNTLCKLIPIAQCTNILVSTATIVAIAVDRYLTIVKYSQSSRGIKNVSFTIFGIWLTCFTLALPLAYSFHVQRAEIHGIFLYHRCINSWDMNYVREIFSFGLLVVQYVIPSLTLLIVHNGIRQHLTRHIRASRNIRRSRKEIVKNRKMTALLFLIASIFAVSWLPWHIVNILADLEIRPLLDVRFLYLILGITHIIAMTTACSNPIIYGWFNTTLRKELLDFYHEISKKVKCKLAHETSRQTSSEPSRPSESIRMNDNQDSGKRTIHDNGNAIHESTLNS